MSNNVLATVITAVVMAYLVICFLYPPLFLSIAAIVGVGLIWLTAAAVIEMIRS